MAAAVSHVDQDALQEIKEFVQSQGQDTGYASILKALDKPTRAAKLAQSPISDDAALQWRRNVRNIVRRIIRPEDVDWMDDEEAIGDVQFIERALIDVRSRFARSVVTFRLHICTHTLNL